MSVSLKSSLRSHLKHLMSPRLTLRAFMSIELNILTSPHIRDLVLLMPADLAKKCAERSAYQRDNVGTELFSRLLQILIQMRVPIHPRMLKETLVRKRIQIL